jgi:CO/xanthine dehydrogenase FAD-binding subunit
MIEEYIRPETLKEAIRILERDTKSVFPLGGGNVLSRSDSEKVTVVDLQLLNFDKITSDSTMISIGACATLQSLVENESLPQAIKEAAIREGTINIRRTATIAGALVSSRGQSPLGAVLLAMGAKVITEPNGIVFGIREWISTLKDGKPARLVARLEIPAKGKTAYLDIRKTPADVPLAYSAMNVLEESMYTWVLGFNKGIGLLIETGKTPSVFLENAYSHYNINEKLDSDQKQIIKILHERLINTLTENGRGK